ncbi:glycosyltransferase family 2 protein [Marinivivus vitaminiproducens]|uniref:glycosyltransferase family 2 protein n=1 Tax=Marinivivus vitaminiproducens TaxID=3035935 RepID=UPI0027A576C4|nr:glycosyltransferase family 2 protein [Geminicoccaceae bacterium SCSIO 64248]
MPKVSVGIPVYNGADYVPIAIRSAIAQTFEDIEIIVLDNASTDDTERVCREMATTDPRIRYERRPENVGAAANYNGCVERATGTYFIWLCHDDILAPTYVEQAVAILESRPDLALCFGGTCMIDEQGKPLRYDPLDNVFIDAQGGRRGGPAPADLATQETPAERFLDVMHRMIRCFHVFGLHRLSVLKQTMMHQPIYGADKNFVAELALYGKFYQLPDDLFYKREHAKQSLAIDSAEGRARWINPNAKRELFPHLRLHRLSAQAILRSPIPFGQKLRLLTFVLRQTGLRKIILNPRNWRPAYLDQKTIG